MDGSQTVVVRRAEERDAPALQRLIHETIDACYTAAYPPRAVEFFKTFHREEQIVERLRSGATLLAEEGDRAIATGSIVGHEILGVFVLPASQGRGWGRAIMAELEGLARADGHGEVSLSVSLPSRRFYETLGYEVVEERSIDVGEEQRLDYWEARKPLPRPRQRRPTSYHVKTPRSREGQRGRPGADPEGSGTSLTADRDADRPDGAHSTAGQLANDLSAADVLEAFPFYVMLVDDRHRIVQANAAVRGQLGLTPEEVVGQYCPRAIHGCDGPWYGCPLEEATATDEAVEREVRDHATGRWVRSAIYPTGRLTADGHRVYFHAVSDITAAKETEEQLRASQEQLRELSRFLESVRETERTRLAREIHDELGQSLTALKIDLSWIAKRLDADERALLDKTAALTELVDGALQTVKRIATELRPAVLDDLGLADALEWQTQEVARHADLAFSFSARPRPLTLERERSTAVFRICQEALTNVIRHAHATRVSVRLTRRADTVSLRVEDDGVGIGADQAADSYALGLLGMRERARPWGGTVEISGVAGKGTVVTVTIPLDPPEAPAC